MRKLLLIFLAFVPLVLIGQDILGVEEYYQLVLQNHPKSKQAQLYNAGADFALRAAKGAFDPVLAADWAGKQFDGKNYYSIGESGLKVPTRFGVNFQSGFLWSDGIFLNPERSLPTAGQAVLGVELPLLNGLITDPKRTALRQAELGITQAALTQQELLNDLMVKAAGYYWNWNLAARKLQLIEQALSISRVRFEGVRESYLTGDKPAIDTLESWIQVQQRIFDREEASNELAQAGLQLLNYVWPDAEDSSFRNLDWQADPAQLDQTQLPGSRQAMLDSMQLFQANIRQLLLMQESMDLERRLAREALKPTLNLKYNLLADGWRWGALPFSDVPQEELLLQNYALGVEFAYPIFQRKARNKVRMIEVKQQQLELQTREIEQYWQVKVDQFYTQLQYLDEQIDLYTSVSANYFQLLQAEQVLFDLGESSIFLINSREQKWLDAQKKLIKLQADFHKTYAKLQWAVGGNPWVLSEIQR